jgi:hypothetical protein
MPYIAEMRCCGQILTAKIKHSSGLPLMQMALVPMGDYVFFLAQFQTFGYCAVYFAALAIRYK